MFKGYFEYPEGYPWKLPKFVLGCPTSLRKKPVVCMQNKRIKQLKPFSEELREQKNGEVKQHDKENRTWTKNVSSKTTQKNTTPKIHITRMAWTWVISDLKHGNVYAARTQVLKLRKKPIFVSSATLWKITPSSMERQWHHRFPTKSYH